MGENLERGIVVGVDSLHSMRKAVGKKALKRAFTPPTGGVVSSIYKKAKH